MQTYSSVTRVPEVNDPVSVVGETRASRVDGGRRRNRETNMSRLLTRKGQRFETGKIDASIRLGEGR